MDRIVISSSAVLLATKIRFQQFQPTFCKKFLLLLKGPTSQIRSALRHLPESGTNRQAISKDIPRHKFFIFNFDLEYSKGVQNSIVLHAQIYLITNSFGGRGFMFSRTLIFELYNAGLGTTAGFVQRSVVRSSEHQRAGNVAIWLIFSLEIRMAGALCLPTSKALLITQMWERALHAMEF